MKIDNIIHLFTSNRDYNQDTIGKGVLHNGNVVATNGRILIVAPTKYILTNNYESLTKKFPDYERVIPAHDKDNMLFQTDYRFISDEANLMPRNDEYTECERCEGEGHLYTNNHNEVECDECEGSGNDEYLGNLIATPNAEYDKSENKTFLFKVGDAYFNPNYLQNIARIASALDAPMNWVRVDKDSAAIIYIADIMVLLMPLKWEESKKEYLGDCTEILLSQGKIKGE